MFATEIALHFSRRHDTILSFSSTSATFQFLHLNPTQWAREFSSNTSGSMSSSPSSSSPRCSISCIFSLCRRRWSASLSHRRYFFLSNKDLSSTFVVYLTFAFSLQFVCNFIFKNVGLWVSHYILCGEPFSIRPASASLTPSRWPPFQELHHAEVLESGMVCVPLSIA